MNTQIKLKNKHSIAQLQSAIKKSNDEAQKTRLRVIIKLKKGLSKTKIAKDFTIDRTRIIAWVKIYNEKGIGDLSMSKGGRPEGNPKWDKGIFEDLFKEVKKNDNCWSIPLMQEWISKEKKVHIPESTIGYHLKLAEFTYKSLRPHPYLGNEKNKEIFKKKD